MWIYTKKSQAPEIVKMKVNIKDKFFLYLNTLKDNWSSKAKVNKLLPVGQIQTMECLFSAFELRIVLKAYILNGLCSLQNLQYLLSVFLWENVLISGIKQE